MFDVNDLAAIKVGLASPETIRSWSHGEVTKPETINYRSQKPEPDGLFCEKIFGPSKDYECHCGKYKKIRFAGTVCEKCGVLVTTKDVRRERMGSITLASPCTHIWYLKGVPSRIGLILDVSPKHLEEVVYFAAHICLYPGNSKILSKAQFLDEKEARRVFVDVINEFKDKLDPESYDYTLAEEYIVKMQTPYEAFDFQTISRFISKHTVDENGRCAEFGEGAEAVKRLLVELSEPCDPSAVEGDANFGKTNLDAEFDRVNAKLREEAGKKKKNNQTFEKLKKRLEVIEAFRHSGNKPEWMVLDIIPVIPPDLRPMLQLDGGRFATSDLNDLYRRVITRNARLRKLIDMNAPYVILMNEKRMLQEAVDALIDNGRRNKAVTGTGSRPLKSLSSALKGKQGRFRQNLLGKRVDYSGRSVIAVGPDLKMYQCGLPREMAIQLLKPFIASRLLSDGVCNAHRAAERYIDRRDEKVYAILEDIISSHPVLLNRAPTLHRLGIQAFQPKLVDGHAIRLHPLVCTGFNADFDGDQMAVHVPLGKAAQEEALNLMLASNNILGPKDGKPIVTPSQDMVLGNYYLTLESSKDDFLKKAKKCRDIGDEEEAIKYELYAREEGKVFASVDEVIHAYQTKNIHLHNRIALLGRTLNKASFTEEQNNSYLLTTVGKVIFNQIYPSEFPYLNEPTRANLNGNIDKYFVKRGTNIKEEIAKRPLVEPFKKGDIGNIINQIFQQFGTSKTSAVLDKIKDQGFYYSTVAGITISIDDINVLSDKQTLLNKGEEQIAQVEELYDEGLLTDQERHKKVTQVWTDVRNQVEKELKAQIAKDKRNPIYMMKDSGARGSDSNFTQLSGMRGLMSNPKGEVIEVPIKSCFREGLSVSEFFIATHGARKGGADTALKTADSGYLTRRLVDVSQDVIVREVDCGTDHGFVVKDIMDTSRTDIIVPLKDRLVGRYSLRAIIHPETGEIIVPANTLIEEADADRVVAAGIKEVEIRSLFGCETKNGVCVHCYGRNLATGKVVEVGEAVGTMAAQSIGEPGTQLTMRTFHEGGVSGSDITQGLPRVQELFEARNPKGKAVISEINGTVEIREKENKAIVTNDKESKTYDIPFGARMRVRNGDTVKSGGKITEGAISPKELLECAGVTSVENYLIKEVQKVYRSQGIGISDKHIEVIVRQMLRKVAIIEGGDTHLLPGMRVSVEEFTETNARAMKEGKRPAMASPLILRITEAALQTDSFLSAASFQETTRVLTDAAIKAKTDYLHGLKENVITGKLIPAGRGLLSEDKEEELLEDFDVLTRMDEVKTSYIEAHDRHE